MNEKLSRSRILVIDDTEANLFLLEVILEDIGYRDVLSISDPAQAFDTWRAFDPDLVLLDLHMPGLSGLDVLAQLRADPRPGFIPVLMLTADASAEAKVRALSTGANDFLTKPFDRVEVQLRIANLLQIRHLHLELQEQNLHLEQKVADRTREVAAAKDEILARLAMAAEFRDDQTGEHTQRVGLTAALVAENLGLPPEEIRLIRSAAPLHDVGKIGIPDSVLLKPGPLDAREREMMRRHTEIGARLVSRSDTATLKMAEQIAATHHEHWDGEGYGSGLSGEDIPICGRIVAVTDVFDALTHERPYKEAWPVDAALDEIRSQRGKQFDPAVVDAFIAVQGVIDLREVAEATLEPRS